MIHIALGIFALAAGVHLLIRTKEAGLGILYKALSWLVILLAVAFLAHGIHHARHMHERHCEMSNKCDMGHGESACPYMKGGSDCCMHGKGECSEGKGSCTKGEMPACCKKDGEEGKAACCEKGTGKDKPACCTKGAKADSTAKK